MTLYPVGHKRWRSKSRCANKAAYGTEASARRIGHSRLARHEEGSPDRLWAYACPACRKWHLTRQEGRTSAITRTEMYEGTGL